MNNITITGNLVHAPKLSQTQSGVAMLTFTVADNKRVKGQENTNFFDVTVWRGRAEALAKLDLRGGTKVAVSGEMMQRHYEKDGQKRTVWGVTASEVELLSPRTAAPAVDDQDAGVPDYRPDLPAIDDDDLPF